MKTKTLKEQLRVDPKVSDATELNVCAKHLRELGLDAELEIASDVPDWRPVRVSAGKMRKVLEVDEPATKAKPAKTKTAAEKKADADAKKMAAAKKKADAKKAAEDKKAEAANEGDKPGNDSE